MNPENQKKDVQKKVVMISSDRGIFEDGKSIRSRMSEYGTLVKELHIIVFATKDCGFVDTRIAENVYAYPTNSKSRWSYLRDAFAIVRWLVRKRGLAADLITCQDPFETGWVGVKVKKKYGWCLQLQIHTDFLGAEFGKRSLLNRLRVIMAKRTLPAADCIRVVSKRIEDSLRATGWEITRNIVLLPILVDKNRFEDTGTLDEVALTLRKKYAQFGFLILVVARFTKEKNIPLALQTLKKITERYSNVGMVIVGDGPEKNHLMHLSRALGLENNVVFEPRTEHIVSYYRAANAFLLTSDYEGYSMVFIEAALAGCPVVTTAVGVTDTSIADGVNGFVCPVRDSICLASRMGRLIEEKHLARSFALRARESVKESLHDKDEYLRRYAESWNSCCAITRPQDIWEQNNDEQ